MIQSWLIENELKKNKNKTMKNMNISSANEWNGELKMDIIQCWFILFHLMKFSHPMRVFLINNKRNKNEIEIRMNKQIICIISLN